MHCLNVEKDKKDCPSPKKLKGAFAWAWKYVSAGSNLSVTTPL
jgi:hypothetical protein